MITLSFLMTHKDSIFFIVINGKYRTFAKYQ